MTDLDNARQSLRTRLYADEDALVRDLIVETGLAPSHRSRIGTVAATLVTEVRAQGRTGLVEDFLGEFGLDTEEGLALMSLAEALLRVPDTETVDALIQDKVGGADWTRHRGGSTNPLVNFSAWALDLTADVLGTSEVGPRSALHRAVARLGEPVIRVAVGRAMRLMGGQFVFGRTIEEAIAHARRTGGHYSFDMLGEAARTAPDAARYFAAYAEAIAALAPVSTAASVRDNPGISVKLSALHPRYEFAQRERVLAELVPSVTRLARAARAANMGFNIDAEEADRLDLSLDVIAAVLADPGLAGWDGFGVVVQAYGKRVLPLVDWLDALAGRLGRRLMVRLVKGAYWDAEIKRAQAQGLPGYPVFTRKAATDVSYIAAARRLFASPHLYPQFATHNAHTAAAVLHLAEAAGRQPESFEFQRLHGMGEALHVALARQHGTRTRVYAPVGAHRDLLAYLVRRLLENGANGSFVHQIADDEIPVDAVVADPIARLIAAPTLANPTIPAPAELFAPRRNSAGHDLTDPLAFTALSAARDAFAVHRWHAHPLIAASTPAAPARERRNPSRPDDIVGNSADATPEACAVALTAAASSSWSATPPSARADFLRRAADLYEANTPELLALLAREAGKTWADAVAEIREAVDFLRYYAEGIASLEGAPRGPFACISPWNFPLAIFTGQVAAALAAGNPVLAKPAPQTPLIAFRAVELLHEAGIPADALQLLPGGPEVGAALTSLPGLAGVAFTGSLPTARRIEAAMADHLDPTAPLIAETGGLNAMIVDSTALPEQAVRDIVASAFQSAGQRCSALRMLYVQEDAAERVLDMLKGAMDELVLGDPWLLATDIGPLIDADAKARIADYLAARRDWVVHALPMPAGGNFLAPTLLRVNGIADLPGEVFGPVLHVATFAAAELDDVVAAINATGYGLTFGLHTRISSRVRRLSAAVRAGNIYVNRNQIGAVVGSQPFGGEGLSGTGPKAGGPAYLPRFTDAAPALDPHTMTLPGPTGESNELRQVPRGTLLCLGPSDTDRTAQRDLAEAAGCTPILSDLDPAALATGQGIDAVAWFGDRATLRTVRQALARRDGAILPLLSGPHEAARLMLERHVCIDTTAAGGNAALLAGAE